MATIARPPSNSALRAGSVEGLVVSRYERVTGWMMALVLLLGSAVAALFMLWFSNRVVPSPPKPVEVLPLVVEDIDGGYEHGVLGETIELPGEITTELGTGKPASLDAMLEQTLTTVRETVTTGNVALADPLWRDEEPWATGIGGTRGTGNAPPLGSGGGTKGGVRRGERWLIEYEAGATLEEYAIQLDSFQIVLGALQGNQVWYASSLSQPTPATSNGTTEQEKRLYFSWRNGELQAADRELLTRAGVDVNGKIVVQFFPPETENLIATLEQQFMRSRAPGRDLKEVRRTRFGVRRDAAGAYELYVKDQTYLK